MYTLIIISFCNDSALALPQAVAFLHWPGARDFKFSIMSDSDLTRPGEPRPLGAAGMPGPPQRWQSVYDSERPGISESAGPPLRRLTRSLSDGHRDGTVVLVTSLSPSRSHKKILLQTEKSST
jgi:hypothetical protein